MTEDAVASGLTYASVIMLADRYCQYTGNERYQLLDELDRLEADTASVRDRYLAQIQWFSNHWPEGLPWIADVPRPEPANEAAA